MDFKGCGGISRVSRGLEGFRVSSEFSRDLDGFRRNMLNWFQKVSSNKFFRLSKGFS